MQQVLAYETDLLEYGDLFDGSHAIEKACAELRTDAQAELDDVLSMGGVFEAVDALKGRLVNSMAERTRRIETGQQTVVGVNRFTETAPSPLGGEGSILTVDPLLEAQTVAAISTWRSERDQSAVDAALGRLRAAAGSTENVMPASIELARAGGTTGEWGDVMREAFGEYRAPTGVSGATHSGGIAAAARSADGTDGGGTNGDGASGSGAGDGAAGGVNALAEVAEFVRSIEGGPIRLLVAKPGLDGHSNGAEQIAVAARDVGMEVVYSGIRLTLEQIAASARDEDPDVIGLSILSGSHLQLVPDLIDMLRAEGVDSPVVVGGIIPEADQSTLATAGVAAVFTPKDYELAKIMRRIAELGVAHRTRQPA